MTFQWNSKGTHDASSFNCFFAKIRQITFFAGSLIAHVSADPIGLPFDKQPEGYGIDRH